MANRCLAVLALVLAGCSSAPATRAPRAQLPAGPEFCTWAEAVAASVPTLPAIDAGQPLDVDRLIQAGARLTRFADTLATAATHAPSRAQGDFTFLADFNRAVAEVIAGEQALDETQLDAAVDAAVAVGRTLSEECGVVFEPSDGLAYTSEL